MVKEKDAPGKDPLGDLIEAADAAMLGQLIQQLAATRPDVRRECFDFLRKHATSTSDAKAEAETGAVFALWDELDLDLAEMDEYGGADHETQEHVDELLYELSSQLRQSSIARDDRRALLDEVMPYIRSGNAGMDDALYDVAYAACKDDEDLRDFAQRLEALGREWPLDHARRIYRRLGDRGKYLALRASRMEYGADYHDLATFHWEQGEREQALKIASEGMKKAKGRMDELRAFMADRARESGDREGYLELQFAQATDHLTLASYKAFEELCGPQEWAAYEPRMLAATKRAWEQERLEIHMHRRELDQAASILSRTLYPDTRYGDDALFKIAARLETEYPDEILAFYKSGLGNLDQTSNRGAYARRAMAARRVRHMWVDVIGEPARWEAFARRIKTANRGRPAFQEEFARLIPGWKEL